MLLESLTRFQENEARLREILFVLGKYGLADWIGRPRTRWLRQWMTTPNGQRIDQCGHEERIRLALLELGTTFVKFGQMLSTRPEQVGETLAAELSKLQAATPADSTAVIRRTIEAELGKPPEELFAEFHPEALASASIAQVHRARLHSGELVVVKVQHDGIETKIYRDLDLLFGLAQLAQKHVPALRNYRPVSTVREFRRTLLRELDLRAERRNLEEFVRHFAGDANVHFPRVYPELCGRRVLTMDWLDGVAGCDVRKAANEVDLAGFARRAATMYLDMIFRDGFYHADPHPGNYVILPGGVVGVLDCGMVGRLDEELRDEIEAALWAVAERDVEELVERIVHIGSPPPDLDRDALRADVAEFVAEYASLPIKELDLSAVLRDVIDIVARYHILLPANVSLLLRTLIVLEGSARQLDPAFSLMDVIVEYRTRSGSRWLLPRRWLRDARRTARGYERLLQLLPEDLGDIVHRFRVGKFELKHEHRHLQASVHHLVQGLLTAALLVSAALLLGQGEGFLPNLVRLVLGFGFLICAVLLGCRLLWAIRAAERRSPWE
jgi:ubiquinone biosynthesis protein